MAHTPSNFALRGMSQTIACSAVKAVKLQQLYYLLSSALPLILHAHAGIRSTVVVQNLIFYNLTINVP